LPSPRAAPQSWRVDRNLAAEALVAFAAQLELQKAERGHGFTAGAHIRSWSSAGVRKASSAISGGASVPYTSS
jgi:hypothetical protein